MEIIFVLGAVSMFCFGLCGVEIVMRIWDKLKWETEEGSFNEDRY